MSVARGLLLAVPSDHGIDHIRVADLRAGDVIGTIEDVGWWSVSGVKPAPGAAAVVVTVQSIDSNEVKERVLPRERSVRRTDPAAVHHKDEFLGMPVDDAQTWAAALGWGFRNYSASGVFTDEEPHNRIDVWTDRASVVIRTIKY